MTVAQYGFGAVEISAAGLRSSAESVLGKGEDEFPYPISSGFVREGNNWFKINPVTAMRRRPKYQVFISSTYGDLREEREAVTWAVLSARHIPAGMENFTATDDRGWQTITSVIDSSDYYVLILAGRYGSVGTDGKSWTEKEYEYALSRHIPILAFVRTKKSITANLMDDDEKSRLKLKDFTHRVKNNHHIHEWDEKADLVAHVTSALFNHMQSDEDGGRGRPGWYRGDELSSLERHNSERDVQSSAIGNDADGAILSPSQGEKVPQRASVLGRIELHNPELQGWLVVEAPNGVIYPQTRVGMTRATWKHEVRIGRERIGVDNDSEFRIDLVTVGPDSAYQFEKYIRGESESKDGLGRIRPADMKILDSRLVIRQG